MGEDMPSGKTLLKPGLEKDELVYLLKNTEDDYYPTDDMSLYEDALCYQPTRFNQLQEMVNCLDLKKEDVFVDFGCGKGRVVCFMAMQEIRKVIGIELRRELVEQAIKNAKELNPGIPVEIIQGDSATFYSEEGTIYYMFNPFGQDTVKCVLNNISDSLKDNPRQIKIVYNNPVYGYYLDQLDWLERAGDIGYTGIRIWQSTAMK